MAKQFDPEDRGSISEKDYSADESDYSYTSSSRSSIHSDTHILRNCDTEYESHPPMLQISPLNHQTSFYYSRIKSLLWQCCCVCTPRRCTRYFNLTILTTIVLVIFTLTRQSWSSSQVVGLGLKKQPAPPPTWEKFPLLKRYYGGIRTLVSASDNIPEYPVEHETNTNQNSTEEQTWTLNAVPQSFIFQVYPEDDGIRECFLDSQNKVKVPDLRAYSGIPSAMPDSVIGSYNVLGLRDDVCFERFGKLGP